jgi:hypothetical protein
MDLLLGSVAMARPLRIEYDGALYHVTSRGNERKPIFRVGGLSGVKSLSLTFWVRPATAKRWLAHYGFSILTPIITSPAAATTAG